jgi:hypothetical protein
MIVKTSRNLINRKQQQQKIADLLVGKKDGVNFAMLEFFGIGGLGKPQRMPAATRVCRSL